MVGVFDINETVDEMLIIEFGHKIYDHKIKEGYETPCFFVDIVTRDNGFILESRNRLEESYLIKINYFPRTNLRIEMLKMIDSLKKLFILKLEVKDRFITIENSYFKFIGEDEDILEFSVNIKFFNRIPRALETEYLIEKVNFRGDE